MSKSTASSPVRIMSEVGLMAATGFILDVIAKLLSRGLFPSGGSISIAMIAILVIAFRRGFFPALGVGFILAVFDLLQGPFLIASTPWRIFCQVLLDYVLPYPLVAVAGLFRRPFLNAGSKKKALKYLVIGVIVGAGAKLASHFLAGIFFWADPDTFAWGLTGMSPYLYCFLYNFAYMGPSMVLCGILLSLMFLRAPRLFGLLQKEQSEASRRSKKGILLGTLTLAYGLFMFVISLISYVTSYVKEDYGAAGTQISFDPVFLLLWVIGIAVILLGFFALGNAVRNYKPTLYPLGLGIVSSISFLMSFSYALTDFAKGRSDWRVGVMLITSVVFLTVGVHAYRRLKRQTNEKRAEE